MNRKRGFTLIELTAVLVIVALLSAVIGTSLASVSRQVTVREVVASIADLDRSMRIECVDFDRRGDLRFDLDTNQILLSMVRDDEAVGVQAYTLPTGTKLSFVQLSGDGHESQPSGMVTVRCDNRGQTPTYAIALSAAGETGVEQVFLVVAGLTGEVREVQDESDIKNLFAQLSGGHTD